MTPFSAVPVPIYQDNYVWLIQSGEATWVVDPGDHEPVLAALAQHRRSLDGILVTHHHWDHITGIAPLLEHYGNVPVYGPAGALISHPVREGNRVLLGKLTAQVWETPGHTRDHVSFYLPQAGALFCGDTLFSAGCGRLFDGTMEQLYASLRRIAALPGATRIYCTHEYTLANLNFALAVEPANADLKRRREEAIALRRSGQPTLPAELAWELRINPFLRTQHSEVRASVKKEADLTENDDFLIFRELRMWKNRY